MKPIDKENVENPESNKKSPIERVETPFPAQEMFPLNRQLNDGKQKQNTEGVEDLDRKDNNNQGLEP